ncbi:MAG: AAA family ATPase [Rhodothermaceae bacterium]|nr:AAA family ATPase [Rhodothermaceae bacterium]MYH13198.1 AAA family ATPase [Rhodothermaceae bacterium]MYJ50632.1 AAA family ATPase [Rhodothermaceae bacterium]
MMDRSKSHVQHRNDYHVRVKNFGPIAEGSIDIRPLTVFVGPSNTGKSYLATLIYALHRCFAADLDETPYSYAWRIRSSGLTDEIISDPDIKEYLDAWISSVKKQDDMPSFSGPVEDVIRSMVEETGDMEMYIERELYRCFGLEAIRELIRRPRAQSAEVIIDLHRREERCNMQYRLGIRRNEFNVTGKVIGSKLPSPDLRRSREGIVLRRRMYSVRRSSKRDVFDSRPLLMLAVMTRNALTSLLRRRAYYLPADRTGVMHSHQVVVSTLIQNATKAGLRPAVNVPTLSGVLADFLNQLIQMASGHGSKGHENGDLLASRVEETVLRGGVNIDASEANYPHFFYKPEGWKAKLPLMRSSSMVSDLAPMILYLRHVVRPGDVIIIEEPESHLHPAMQIEVIRRLAEIVRSGIQVIVTTHSEWVLDELANMVLSFRKGESEQAFVNKATDSLNPREVGVWSFGHQETSEGVVIKELELDKSGSYPSGFDRVAVDQHNRWVEAVGGIEFMDE